MRICWHYEFVEALNRLCTKRHIGSIALYGDEFPLAHAFFVKRMSTKLWSGGGFR